MKLQNETQYTIRLFVTTCLFAFTLSAHGAIYVKLGDIKGESTSAQYFEWIDGLAVMESMSAEVAGSGSTRETGTVNFQDITLSKYLDSTSPQLRLSIAAGTHFPEALVVITASSGDSEVEIFRITMKQVMVTSVSMSANSGADRPTENITLNFSEIEWEYTKIGKSGSETGKTSAGWNLETNTKI